jgi:uncharacterized glyoxalase superfamily protein PhnB
VKQQREIAMQARKILDTAWGIIPHFPCHSVRATAKFYTEDLHFELGGINPEEAEEPDMCSVAIGKPAIRGNIYLFKTQKGETLHPAAAMIALGTEAVDQYHDLLQAEGKVQIIEPIEDKPWGYRQFAIQDLDGNKIQFFRFLEGGNPGDGSS